VTIFKLYDEKRKLGVLTQLENGGTGGRRHDCGDNSNTAHGKGRRRKKRKKKKYQKELGPEVLNLKRKSAGLTEK